MQAFYPEETLKVSGSGFDCPDLYAQWLGFLARHVGSYGLASKIQPQGHFQNHARCRCVRGFTLARFVSAADRYRLVRDRSRIAGDGHDRYCLCVALRGAFEVSQSGCEAQIEAGTFSFVTLSEPSRFANGAGGANDMMVLLLPQDFVTQRLINPQPSLCARRFASSLSLVGLAYEALAAFERRAWRMNDDAFQNSVRVIAELALLAGSGSGDNLSGERSIRAANLARAKRIMRGRLGNPELTLAQVAHESGFSLSYLHNLFRDSQLSAREYLMTQRLQRARELLALCPAGLSVADVAFECGFRSNSYFSTAFRRAFGVCAKDVRNSSVRDAAPSPTGGR